MEIWWDDHVDINEMLPPEYVTREQLKSAFEIEDYNIRLSAR